LTEAAPRKRQHYSYNDLVLTLRRLDDGLWTTMNPFERADWVARAAFMVHGMLSIIDEENAKEESD
jgi:hypothetical protein